MTNPIQTDHEQVTPHPTLPQYYPQPEKRRRFISTLFDDNASQYDWIIRVMSFGSGSWYRRQALQRAGLMKNQAVLDVATGTGPVAKAEQAIVGPEGLVIGLDRSYNMLVEARKRVDMPVAHAGAEALPFPDGSFDFISMGYALRHVDDLRNTFKEYFRVLRPGGVVLLMELTKPSSPLGFKLCRFYLHKVVPWIAKIGSGEDGAATMMKYFWDTIEHCVPPEQILQAMADSGFSNTERHRVFGVFSEYTGVKRFDS